MKNYPYKKVIFLFTLAPMIGGVILAIAFYISFFIKMIIEEPLFQYLTFFNVLKWIFLVPIGSFVAGLFGEIASRGD